MESGINKKIKVAWICHFSDEFIQEKLPLWKKSSPFGAWIRNTLEGFKSSKEFEIHVIAPHQYLKKNFSFEEDGIHFHFFKTGIPFINRSWPSFFDLDLLSNFYMNRLRIRRIIDKIKPDLINLQGAENAYYSISALDLYKQFPLIVTIQGFIGLERETTGDKTLEKRVEIENKVIKKCSYFGGDVDSEKVISEIKKEKFGYYNYLYPLGSSIEPYINKFVEKKYDLLFWSRVCKDKGAEDFLHIVSKLKSEIPNVKACVIGPVSAEYLSFLKQLCAEDDIIENVTFIGFVEKTDDLYNLVLGCKIIVTPTYNDRLPTVLREAVFLRIAVISYKTGSIPQFNKDEEVILLTEQGDIDGVVQYAADLLKDQEFYKNLVEKAFEFGRKEFGVSNNCEKMSSAYINILNKN